MAKVFFKPVNQQVAEKLEEALQYEYAYEAEQKNMHDIGTYHIRVTDEQDAFDLGVQLAQLNAKETFDIHMDYKPLLEAAIEKVGQFEDLTGITFSRKPVKNKTYEVTVQATPLFKLFQVFTEYGKLVNEFHNTK